MSDGAAQGITPNRALETIIGGDPAPDPDEGMTPSQMRKWILASPGFQPELAGGEGYDAAAREAARLILTAFEADPSLLDEPVEAEYDWDGDPDHGAAGWKPEYAIHLGLYQLLKERGLAEQFSELGLSGFQWGWAVNAARTCVGADPEPNPAILDIET